MRHFLLAKQQQVRGTRTTDPVVRTLVLGEGDSVVVDE